MTRTGQRKATRVGIFFLVSEKLLFETTPMMQGEEYGSCRTHSRGHPEFWDELVRAGTVPDSEYDEYPRGRVVFDSGIQQYTIYADRCILKDKSLITRILREMQLPKNHAVTATDSHYRCPRCLKQSM